MDFRRLIITFEAMQLARSYEAYHISKYPPAEPGALEREPLKAAVGEASADVPSFAPTLDRQDTGTARQTSSFCGPLEADQHLAFALASCVPYASSSPIMKFFSCAWCTHGWDLHRWGDSGKRQTFTATPAEPGELPFWLESRDHF